LKNSVQVTILGQIYTVRSEAGPQEVLQVSEFVNRRIQEAQNSSGTANSFTAVVLALLNVAGELFELQKRGQESGAAEERLQALLARLEKACPGAGQGG
jgi:cell division protein ZapA